VTVWIYVDTSKDVGDKDHLMCSLARKRLMPGSLSTIPRASSPSRMRFRTEPQRHLIVSWPPA
jgi:hypothetical protein